VRQILIFSLALCLLVLSATPGLTHRADGWGASNIAPGTRFGREPLARQPYPYLYPVNPELYRQEHRERRKNEIPADEPSQAKPENEPPAKKKPPVKPKFIEVK
jgi:hypothetical protein